MATAYTVRELSYAYIVEWGGRERAVVITQDPDERLYWCYRCGANACPHARHVVHHLIDQEST